MAEEGCLRNAQFSSIVCHENIIVKTINSKPAPGSGAGLDEAQRLNTGDTPMPLDADHLPLIKIDVGGQAPGTDTLIHPFVDITCAAAVDASAAPYSQPLLSITDHRSEFGTDNAQNPPLRKALQILSTDEGNPANVDLGKGNCSCGSLKLSQISATVGTSISMETGDGDTATMELKIMGQTLNTAGLDATLKGGDLILQGGLDPRNSPLHGNVHIRGGKLFLGQMDDNETNDPSTTQIKSGEFTIQAPTTTAEGTGGNFPPVGGDLNIIAQSAGTVSQATGAKRGGDLNLKAGNYAATWAIDEGDIVLFSNTTIGEAAAARDLTVSGGTTIAGDFVVGIDRTTTPASVTGIKIKSTIATVNSQQHQDIAGHVAGLQAAFATFDLTHIASKEIYHDTYTGLLFMKV